MKYIIEIRLQSEILQDNIMFLPLPTVSPKLVLSRAGNHSEKQYWIHSRTTLNGAQWIARMGEQPSALAPAGTLPCKLYIAAGLHFVWQGEYCHSNTVCGCNQNHQL